MSQKLRSEDVEVEMEDNGDSNSSVGGGVKGVVAVLDDGQEMDRCSCDLVKVSSVLKYCLRMCVPPPTLPVPVQQNVFKSVARNTSITLEASVSHPSVLVAYTQLS